MKLIGTPFQIKVWKEITNIPKGKTKTYKEIAINIVHPNSARAVANACARNPHPILIPCHRVVRSDGKIGGYSGPGGESQKKKLLLKEKYKYEIKKNNVPIIFEKIEKMLVSINQSNIIDDVVNNLIKTTINNTLNNTIVNEEYSNIYL